MSTSKEQKNHLISEVNSPKSKLLDVARKLNAMPGSSTAARELESLIARLEMWQLRHKR
ncbi:hypothetical protein ACXIVK_00055 [Paraburkholderia caledonica]|jgi:hypothetical protein